MSKTIAIVVFPGVQSLDVTGPMDVFSEANRFLAPEDHYRLEVIGVEHGVMACSNGLSLNAHRHFSEALETYDLLLVAGGPQLPFMNFGAAFDTWLRDACARAQRFGSICNGAFMLARAGLLDGRTVTTHWGDAAALAQLCPSTQVEADRLYVQDGELYTSAGVTAGIDLSLYLLARDHGPDVALSVAKRLVVFTQRSGGQSQFSPFLTPHAEPTSAVALVQLYVLANLNGDLTIADLANAANMSTRNFFPGVCQGGENHPGGICRTGEGGRGAGDARKHPCAAENRGVSVRVSRCPAHAQCVQPQAGSDTAAVQVEFCGDGLAAYCVACHGPFASKPAPTVDRVVQTGTV